MTRFLTNFNAIILQQIVFSLLLIKLLSSIKTIVPTVVNTGVRTQTGKELKFIGEE